MEKETMAKNDVVRGKKHGVVIGYMDTFRVLGSHIFLRSSLLHVSLSGLCRLVLLFEDKAWHVTSRVG
ncbi:hypothetical protein L484_008541 [Morus notabilis]|uniref:Uncharacterized protein n=1 Tax=Morus notabilis TaxID=981085 RepID=W9RWL7_9ROSA|nr:hypothetical protein L484_008541 [Morus notabilis]